MSSGAPTQQLTLPEEHGERLRKDLERLCRRVDALEAAVAKAPKGFPAATEAEAKPLEHEPPPAELGSEPAAGEDDCGIQFQDDKEEEEQQQQQQEEGQGSASEVVVVELPQQCVDDVYTFSESMWDVQLFLGSLLGPANSIMVAIYSVVNFTLQFFFCLIVWSMTTNTVTDDTLLAMEHWRLGAGHTDTNYDQATNTSLVRRVCENFGANNVGATQQSSVASFQAYLPLDGSFPVGPVLATLAVLVWTMTVMIDLWSTESFFEAVLSLRRRTRGGPETRLLYADGQLSVHSISSRRAVYAVLCIVFPRVAIDIMLLVGGIRFLVFENTLPGLILNAVALGFILGLDELVFLLLPRRAKRIIEVVKPVEKKVSFTNAKGHFDRRAALLLLGCVVTIVVTWFWGLRPKVAVIGEAQRLLCDGDLDFVYATEAGTGAVLASETSKVVRMQDSHQVLAVLQRTGLPLKDQLDSFGKRIPASNLWKQTAMGALFETGKKITAHVLSPLECKDHDDDPISARALHSLYNGGYGDVASKGSFCLGKNASWCTSPETAPVARKLCAHKCQCDRVTLVDRLQCNDRCHKAVEGGVGRMAQACGDVSYHGGRAAELRTFYANLLDFLVQQGKVHRNGSRTSLTPEWQHRLVQVTGGRFAMTDNPLFVFNRNLTRWLVADAPVASGVSSPCAFIPFVNRIFDLDLCAPVGSVGSARGFCPQACRAPGCSPIGLHPKATFDQLLEWQRTTGLGPSLQLIFPRLSCGATRDIGYTDIAFFERPAWGNSEYTLRYCSAHGNHTRRAGFVEIPTLNEILGKEGGCSLTALLDLNSSYVIRLDSRNAPRGETVAMGFTCHTDGTLTCGGTVSGSTVGAASARGGPGGERIYRIDAPDTSVVSFETCGSQLDARLSVYDFGPAQDSAGSLHRPQDRTSSCGGAGGASLTMPMPWNSSGLRLVVEGSGSTEGNFTLRTACSYPLIKCGDTIRGSTGQLPSNFGGPSPERIWRFSSGSGGNVTIDTCNSTFDTDIRLLDLNMTQMAYVDATPKKEPRACGWKAHWTSDFPPNLDLHILLEGYMQGQGDFTLALRC